MVLDYNFFSSKAAAIPLEKLVLLRQTERFISNLHDNREITGPCHLGIGQEAISVAISSVIDNSKDFTFASHRSHNSYLAVTLDVFGLLSELARKPFGCSGGRGGSTYLTNLKKGFICSTPILTGGIGLATGAAFAQKIKSRGGVAVVFFGDGAVEEGMFHEALNFSSVFSLPIFFVCENNSYSCNVALKHRQPKRDIQVLAKSYGILSETVDGNDYFQVLQKANYLASVCRSKIQPVFLEAKTFRISGHTGVDEKRDIGVYRNQHEIEEWRNNDPIRKMINSSQNTMDFVDNNLCIELEYKIDQYLKNVWQQVVKRLPVNVEINRPIQSYSNTGSRPSLNDCVENPKPIGVSKKTFLEGLQEGIREILCADSKVLLIGQGVSSPWDSGKWSFDLYKSLKNTQIFESPNSESVTTAAAVGLSMSGVRCIVSHPRIDFLILAADPIVNQASKAFYMSGGKIKVPVVIRAQLYRGNGQGAQHSQALQSWFSHIPGIRVVMPSTPSDARNLLYSSVYSDDPVLFIDDKWLHDWSLEYVKLDRPLLSDQGPEILLKGNHITLVGMGFTTRLCYEVAKELAIDGILCEVIDLRILNPLDCSVIVESCRKTKALLVVDMTWSQCSISSEIISQVSESLSEKNIMVRTQRLHTSNHPAPASSEGECEFYIDHAKIKSKINLLIKEKRRESSNTH